MSAAISEVEAMHAELAHPRLLLSAPVASVYAELAYFYKSHDTAKAAMEVRAKTAGLFRLRYRHGLETLGSVRQVEALFSGAEAAVVALDERIALQKNALAIGWMMLKRYELPLEKNPRGHGRHGGGFRLLDEQGEYHRRLLH